MGIDETTESPLLFIADVIQDCPTVLLDEQDLRDFLIVGNHVTYALFRAFGCFRLPLNKDSYRMNEELALLAVLRHPVAFMNHWKEVREDKEVLLKLVASPNPAFIRGLEEYCYDSNVLPKDVLNLHAHPSFKAFVENEIYNMKTDAKAFRAFQTCLVAAGRCSNDDDDADTANTPLRLLKLGMETEAGMLSHVAKFLTIPSWKHRAWSYYIGEPIVLPLWERQNFKNRRIDLEVRVEEIRLRSQLRERDLEQEWDERRKARTKRRMEENSKLNIDRFSRRRKSKTIKEQERK